MFRRSYILAAVALTSLFCAHAGAAGPTKQEIKKACVAEADQGQKLRSEGKLSLAREQFVRCSRDECPGPLRQDCAQWMNEVVASLPSVVVGARDSAGRDLVDVRVSIDGSEVASELDGKPISVDPGVHTFRYERAGSGPVEEKVVVRAGEKNRPLTVTFASSESGGEKTKTAKPDAGPKSTEPSAPSSGPPALAYVLGGVGLAALGAAAYFDLSASSDVDNLRKTCAPNCQQSQVDSVRTRYTVAGVAAGVGAVSLGVAAYLFLSKPEKSEPRVGRAALRFELRPAPSGATAGLGGAF